MPWAILIPGARIQKCGCCVIFIMQMKKAFMNDFNTWNEADWFAEWLKLARNEGK
jgi:hypothetical protein